VRAVPRRDLPRGSRRRGRLAAALGLALTATVTAAPGALAAPGRTTLCTITDPRIAESSGLAAAGSSLYTVNDGGTRLRVFVLDRACRVRREILNPLDPYDVEDLARGLDGSLWLSDTGDNNGSRETVALERLTESGEATLYRFTYPDGAHDAEALLLEHSGLPYLVTKEPLSAGVYTPTRAPSTDRSTPLRRVATLTFNPTGTPGGPVGSASQIVVTGGAVSPDGSRLALRTYTDAYLWNVPDGDIGEAFASGPTRRIPLPATRQGEAITFSADGRALLTSTEGVPAPVHSITVGAPARPSASATPKPTASGTATARRSGSSAESPSGFRGAAVGALLGAGLVLGAARLLSALRR